MNDIDKLLKEIENDGFDSTPEQSKGKRAAIEKSIKDMGAGFTGSYKMDPLSNASSFIEKAIPRGIRDEYNVIKDAGIELGNLYNNNVRDLKSGAKKTVDFIKMKTPENSVYRSVMTKLSSALGSDDPDRYDNYSKEPTEDEIIAASIEKVFEKNRKKDSVVQVIQEVKDSNKFATTVSILTDILGNLKYGNRFNDEITEKYYRKSLELQFKSLYVTKQQLETTKSGFDLFKIQLEAIVKNTALPDLVKLRNTEQMGDSLKHRFRENITDVVYSKANPLTAMKNNIIRNTGRFISGAKMGFETGNMFLEQANEMAAMGMGANKSEMIGGELAAYLRNFIADETGRAAEKNDFIRGKLHKAKMAMADPRETLYDVANKQFDKGSRMGRINSKILKMIGGITEADRNDFTRFGEYDPDEASTFDFRTKNSIVKVIPGLLARIHSEIKSMRTGKSVEEGLYFDYNTGKLQEDSFIKDSLERDTAVTFQGAAGANLDKFTSILEAGGGQAFTDEERNHIKGVIVGHLVKNGTMSPEVMLKDKFLDQFDPKFRDLIKNSLTGTIEKSKDDLQILDQFRTSLEGTKNNIPLMNKQIEAYFKNGQIESLERMGLVDFDPIRKQYRLNREAYIDILKDSITYDVEKDNFTANTANVEYGSSRKRDAAKVKTVMDEAARKSEPAPMVKKVDTVEKIQDIEKKVDTSAINKHINGLGKMKATVTDTTEQVIQSVVEKTVEVYEKSKAASIKFTVMQETNRLKPILQKTVDETKAKLAELNERIKAPDISDILSKAEVDPDIMYKKYQDSGAAHTGLNFLAWANTLGYTFFGRKFSKLKNKDSVKNEKMRESIFSKVSTNLEEMMEVDKKTGERKFTIRAILKKTREWDRKMFMSIPSVMKKLTVGAFKLPFTLFETLKNGKNKIFGAGDKASGKNKIFGDKDGDGDRDMSWQDRLANGAKGIKDKIFGKSNDKAPSKTSSILSSIWGMLKGALPFLGVIAAFGGKLLKGVMGIVPALGSILGGVIGGVGGVIAKGAGALVTGGLAAGKFVKDAFTGGVSNSGKKVPPGKIMTMLKSFKVSIVKKLGKKAGAKALAVLAAKIAARAVPVAGLALLAYDGAMIANLMINEGLSFSSAVSKQILGFDVNDDTEAAVDDKGEPIKPDENLQIKDPDEAKTTGLDKEISDEDRPKQDKNIFSRVYDKIKNYATDTSNPVGRLVDKTDNYFKTGSFKATPSKQEIMGIIDKAAKLAGVDPNTLKTFAAIESGMDPNAKASTSSAKGLFQFIDGTWNTMIKKHGSKYGLDPMASPYDPMANALMGAEYIKENTKELSGIRDNVGMTDLYLAHFLGAGGAKKFFSARPDEFAAAILPAAARANTSIFFHKDGTPRTVSEVYNLMQNKLIKRASAFGYTDTANPAEQRKAVVESTQAKVNQVANIPTDLKPANNADSKYMNPVNVNSDPVTSGVPTVKGIEAVNSKQAVAIANIVPSRQDVMKADQFDYRPNLTNIENVLLDSYSVQVGIKESIDTLVNYTMNGVIKKDDGKQSINKSSIELPKPTIDLTKKRYSS